MLAVLSSLWLLYRVYAAFVILEPNTVIHANLQRASLDKKTTGNFFPKSSTAKMRQFFAFVYFLAITQGRCLYSMLLFS